MTDMHSTVMNSEKVFKASTKTKLIFFFNLNFNNAFYTQIKIGLIIKKQKKRLNIIYKYYKNFN